LSDIPDHAAFEAAFHRSAERHERVWIFVTIVMLTLLLVGTLFFVVFDYGVIVRTAGFQSDPAAPPTVGPATILWPRR
jgi:cytochrome c oxidase subunit II